MAEGVLAASMFDRRHEKTLSSTPALTRRSLIPPRYGSWAPAVGGGQAEGVRATGAPMGNAVSVLTLQEDALGALEQHEALLLVVRHHLKVI